MVRRESLLLNKTKLTQRVHANVVSTVQNPPTCHICGHQHFWRLCDKLKDPDKIAEIVQNLADKSYCLRCVRPQAVCGGRCTGSFKRKDGVLISTVCRTCTDSSRHYVLCDCRAEQGSVVQSGAVFVKPRRQESSVNFRTVGTTRMLTEC